MLSKSANIIKSGFWFDPIIIGMQKNIGSIHHVRHREGDLQSMEKYNFANVKLVDHALWWATLRPVRGPVSKVEHPEASANFTAKSEIIPRKATVAKDKYAKRDLISYVKLRNSDIAVNYNVKNGQRMASLYFRME